MSQIIILNLADIFVQLADVFNLFKTSVCVVKGRPNSIQLATESLRYLSLHVGPLPWSNWNLEMFNLVRRAFPNFKGKALGTRLGAVGF